MHHDVPENETTENMLSEAMIDLLNLATQLHPECTKVLLADAEGNVLRSINLDDLDEDSPA